MAQLFTFGSFELRPRERTLMSEGHALHVGGRAFDILLVLIERRDRVVEFDELLDLVWPGLAVEENNLSVQISVLRKLLGPESITTVRGRGYQFTYPKTIEHEHRGRSDGTELSADTLTLKSLHHGVLLSVSLVVQNGPFGKETPDIDIWNQVLRDFSRCGLKEPDAKVVGDFSDTISFYFGDPQHASRVALQVQAQGRTISRERSWLIQYGFVSTHSKPGSDQFELDLAVSKELAVSAAPNELYVDVELAGEFVAGVCGDLEDLGEMVFCGMEKRIYRLSYTDSSVKVEGLLGGGDVIDVRPKIAVLPFACFAIDPGYQVVGDILSDEVINCISKNSEFCVISGMSSRRLAKAHTDLGLISRCLDVNYLVSGSVRTDPTSFILNIHVQESATGTVLRSMQYQKAIRDFFAGDSGLGGEISVDISEAIFAKAIQRSVSRPIHGLESYTLLMAAIGLMHRLSFKDFDRARLMLEHLMLRPGGGNMACAWLAKWHVLKAVQGWSMDPVNDSKIALAYVRQSLDLNPGDALSLSIGGLVHAYMMKDMNVAGEMYAEALQSNTSEPLAWLFSATRYGYLGMGKKAEDAAEKAMRLSPVDPLKYFFDSLAGTAVLANQNWGRAVALSRNSLKLNRTHASTWRTLAYGLVMLDQMEEARDAVKNLLSIEPGYSVSQFKERFPGRGGPMAQPWADALKTAGLPE